MATRWLTLVDIGLRYHDYDYFNTHPDDNHNDQDKHDNHNDNHSHNDNYGRARSCTLGPMRWNWMDGCDHSTYSSLIVIFERADRIALLVRKPVQVPEGERL